MNKIIFTEKEEELILKLYYEYKTFTEIQKALNLNSIASIRRFLLNKGIKIRTAKEVQNYRWSNDPNYRKEYSKNKIGHSTVKGKTWKVSKRVFKPNLKGDKHPNWKGGTTELRKKVQDLPEYKFWRKAVFERDNYTCQICENRGGRLNVDHIIPYSIIIKNNNLTTVEDCLNNNLLWDTDNGRTLCEDCHKLTDTYGVNVNKVPSVKEI